MSEVTCACLCHESGPPDLHMGGGRCPCHEAPSPAPLDAERVDYQQRAAEVLAEIHNGHSWDGAESVLAAALEQAAADAEQRVVERMRRLGDVIYGEAIDERDTKTSRAKRDAAERIWAELRDAGPAELFADVDEHDDAHPVRVEGCHGCAALAEVTTTPSADATKAAGT